MFATIAVQPGGVSTDGPDGGDRQAAPTQSKGRIFKDKLAELDGESVSAGAPVLSLVDDTGVPVERAEGKTLAGARKAPGGDIDTYAGVAGGLTFHSHGRTPDASPLGGSNMTTLDSGDAQPQELGEADLGRRHLGAGPLSETPQAEQSAEVSERFEPLKLRNDATSSPHTVGARAIGGAHPPTVTPPSTTNSQPAPIIAAPSDLSAVVSRAMSSPSDPTERLVVQLDPPELGRVTFDFKFDASGAPHVVVTGETSEALRQLRSMHLELAQALERQGLFDAEMSFQQQDQHGGAPRRHGIDEKPDPRSSSPNDDKDAPDAPAARRADADARGIDIKL